MGYLDSLNITGSALTAERFRTDVILQNMANQNTTRTEDGGPYRRKQVVLRENSMSFETQLDKAVKKTDGAGGGERKSLCTCIRSGTSGCGCGRLCYDAQCEQRGGNGGFDGGDKSL